MELLYAMLILSGLAAVIYLIHRYGEVKKFRHKVFRVVIKKMNESKENSDMKKYIEYFEIMRKYSFFDLLFSLKKLKLHFWYTREECRAIDAPNMIFYLIPAVSIDIYKANVQNNDNLSMDQKKLILEIIDYSIIPQSFTIFQDEINTDNKEFNEKYI